MANKEELIVYSNSRNGLGIRILGARRATDKSGIYIKQIIDNGLAQKDGRLKIGDQILSINDELSIGISREHAVNILRSAAATNQVRLHVKHFFPSLSSNEYQKLLYDEKSTDDEDENHRYYAVSQNRNNNNNNTTIETRIRKSSRRSHRHQKHRRSTSNLLDENDQLLKGLDVSQDALQALLNSKFKINDLIDLLKKIYPTLLLNDENKQIKFIEHLTENNLGGRITLKEFERQSSVFFEERINLLIPFYSTSSQTSNTNNDELRQEILTCRSTIDELETKIKTCEKSQRLSNEIELEYEDLLHFLYEQLRQYKINDLNQSRQIRANDQLIKKLFNYLSIYANKSNDEQIISQLKFEYDQQQRKFSNPNDSSIVTMNKSQENF